MGMSIQWKGYGYGYEYIVQGGYVYGYENIVKGWYWCRHEYIVKGGYGYGYEYIVKGGYWCRHEYIVTGRYVYGYDYIINIHNNIVTFVAQCLKIITQFDSQNVWWDMGWKSTDPHGVICVQSINTKRTTTQKIRNYKNTNKTYLYWNIFHHLKAMSKGRPWHTFHLTSMSKGGPWHIFHLK